MRLCAVLAMREYLPGTGRRGSKLRGFPIETTPSAGSDKPLVKEGVK